MRDIAREQAIMAKWDKRFGVTPARRKHVQNLGSEPVISTQVYSKKAEGQAGQARAKPKPIK